MDGLFASSDSNAPRLLWDPTVHKDFEEQLNFIFLRSAEPSSKVAVTIGRLAEAYCMPALSLYSSIGQYDYVIRTWIRGAEKADFREDLEEFYPDVAWFEASHTLYDNWSSHPAKNSRQYRSKYDHDVKIVASGASTLAPESYISSVKNLLNASLLHRISIRDSFGHSQRGPLLKLLIRFSALRSQNQNSQHLLELGALRRTLLAEDDVRVKSLYLSQGFGSDILLKGVIESTNVPMLDAWIDDVLSELRTHGLHFSTTTQVLTRALRPISDAIDPDVNHVDHAGRRLIAIAPELSQVIRRGDEELIRLGTRSFERSHQSFVNTPFHGELRKLFVAYFHQDFDAYKNALFFAILAEGKLDRYLRNSVMPRALGSKEWTKRVDDILGTGKLKTMTLGDWFVVLKRLAEGSDIDLGRFFRPDFLTDLDNLRRVRNLAAHSTRDSSLPRSAQEWYEHLQAALAAGDLYNYLLLRSEQEL